MIGLTPLLNDSGIAISLLHDADGNVRGALMCWAIALCAFIILRVPRQVVLACLFVATLTVGLAAVVVDAAAPQADAEQQRAPTTARWHAARLPAALNEDDAAD